jgi:hypothetical protein
MADESPQVRRLAGLAALADAGVAGQCRLAAAIKGVPLREPFDGRSPAPLQRVMKIGPSGAEIDVIEIPDELVTPACVALTESRRFYLRAGGIRSGWNDTDIFYADGDGALVQITAKMVNEHFDALYQGFERSGGPDIAKNCEDWAKGYKGFGNQAVGSYTTQVQAESVLSSLAKGFYVVNMGYHWMSVERTTGGMVIRQKDAESAIYTKEFATTASGSEYVFNKRTAGGSVYPIG